MKPKGLAKTLLGTSALTAAIVVSFITPSAHAANTNHTLTTTGANNLSTATWTGGAPTNLTIGDIAIYTTATTASTTTIDTNVTIGGFRTNNTGVWTLSAGAGTLTLDGTGLTSANSPFANAGVAFLANTSTAAGGLTVNSNLTLANTNLDIGTTNSGSVIVGGNIVASSAQTISFRANGTGAITDSGSIGASGSNIAIQNVGTSTGGVTLSGSLGSSVTSVTQNSATSALTLSGANTYTGPTNVATGTLTLSGSISSSSALTLGGGIGAATLSYTATAGSTQTFASTAVNSFSTVTNATATNVVNLGAITRNAGSILNVSSLTGTTNTTSAVDSTGILGTWATTGTGTGLKYAAGGSGGAITAYTGTAAATAANVTDTTGTVNYDVAAVGTLGAGASFNTLRYTGAAGTIAGDFTANGLMNAGTGAVTYSGNATIGSNKELVIVGNTQGTTISGAIADNGGGASSLTYGGPVAGTLTLSGVNTYTGPTTITQGNFTISGSGQLNSGNYAGNINILNPASIFTYNSTANQTISGALNGGNLNKQNTGTLTLSGGGTLGNNVANNTGISNGGNNNITALLLGGTTKITSGTYTSANEFVVGGVLANGGAGVNTNFTMDGGSLTIGGGTGKYLSLGRGNGIGAVSSDIVLNNNASITTDNFSAGFNGGNAANLPKGTFTLNGTSSFTVNNGGAGAFILGESAGANMTMTLNDSSTVTTTGTNNVVVGNQNGSGTLTVNGGTFTSGGEIRVASSGSNGAFTGTGTINVSGGTLNTNALTLARNNNDVASTLAATINVTAGALNVKNGTSLIGWRGIGTNSNVNISGGSFNQGTTATANMEIGSFTGSNAAVTVSSSGALTFQNNSSLRFATGAGADASTRTLTINGGNVTFYSNAGTTVGGTGTIDLMAAANASGTNTINLNGGTLTANQIKATSATGTRVINFNGGTLKNAGGNSNGLGATFLAANVATTANVRNGGAIFDTNGNNTTVGQALLHSNIGGDNAVDGGLTKNGLGTLTLGGANTYNGATTINAGTFALASTGSIASTQITAASGATFDVSAVTGYTLTSGKTLTNNGTVNGGFTVASGATVNGSGTFTGAATIAGNLNPGNSPGTVTFTNGLALVAGSNLGWELVANTEAGAGTNFDQVLVTGGALTIADGAMLNVNFGGSVDFTDGFWTADHSWTVISFAGTGDEGALTLGTITGGTGDFNEFGSFSTSNNNGNQVLTWTAVPEPAAALLGGLGMLGLLRRRRIA